MELEMLTHSKENRDWTPKGWIKENEEGTPNFQKMGEETRAHQIEKVGAELRGLMPFINQGQSKPQDISGG